MKISEVTQETSDCRSSERLTKQKYSACRCKSFAYIPVTLLWPCEWKAY